MTLPWAHAVSILVAATVALLLALGGSAGASPRTAHRPASFSFEAHLPSADGYAIYLRAHDRHEIELDVEREAFAEPYVTMTYKVKGQVGEHGIAADLGRFGRVDLRFSGHPKKRRFRPSNCRPQSPEVQTYGEMTGHFRFRSLDGKVQLSVRHVEGETRRDPKRVCTKKPRREVFHSEFFADRRPVAVEGKGEGFVADFAALAHVGGRAIEIYAIKLQNEIVPDLAATSTRRFGPVLLSTSVHAPESEEEVPGEAARFSISGRGTRPRHATLSAPAPFSGTGTYAYRPGSPPTFLGSLKVRIPGEGIVPLAGPEFRTALCNYAAVRWQRACEETAGPPHTA
jgi:hypothetical protein